MAEMIDNWVLQELTNHKNLEPAQKSTFDSSYSNREQTLDLTIDLTELREQLQKLITVQSISEFEEIENYILKDLLKKDGNFDIKKQHIYVIGNILETIPKVLPSVTKELDLVPDMELNPKFLMGNSNFLREFSGAFVQYFSPEIARADKRLFSQHFLALHLPDDLLKLAERSIDAIQIKPNADEWLKENQNVTMEGVSLIEFFVLKIRRNRRKMEEMKEAIAEEEYEKDPKLINNYSYNKYTQLGVGYSANTINSANELLTKRGVQKIYIVDDESIWNSFFQVKQQMEQMAPDTRPLLTSGIIFKHSGTVVVEIESRAIVEQNDYNRAQLPEIRIGLHYSLTQINQIINDLKGKHVLPDEESLQRLKTFFERDLKDVDTQFQKLIPSKKSIIEEYCKNVRQGIDFISDYIFNHTTGWRRLLKSCELLKAHLTYINDNIVPANKQNVAVDVKQYDKLIECLRKKYGATTKILLQLDAPWTGKQLYSLAKKKS